MMWNGMNRRKFPRADYKCIITIKSKEEIPKVIATHTENIGMGGMPITMIVRKTYPNKEAAEDACDN